MSYVPINGGIGHIIIKHPILLVVLAALMLSPLWNSGGKPAVSLVVQTQEAIEAVKEKGLIAEIMTQDLAIKLTNPELTLFVVQYWTRMVEVEMAVGLVIEEKGELFIIFLDETLLIEVCDYLIENHDIEVVKVEN